MIALDAMIIYIAICLVIYAAIIFRLKRYGRQAKSSSLDLEIRNWLIDAALTIGIMGSLLLAVLAIRLGYDQILPYIDPSLVFMLVFVLIALSLPFPLRTAWVESRRLLVGLWHARLLAVQAIVDSGPRSEGVRPSTRSTRYPFLGSVTRNHAPDPGVLPASI